MGKTEPQENVGVRTRESMRITFPYRSGDEGGESYRLARVSYGCKHKEVLGEERGDELTPNGGLEDARGGKADPLRGRGG